MELKIFAIYDIKAEAYLQPFFLPTVGMALRSWTEAVNDPQTKFHLHPSDYTLFQIGTFNQTNGSLYSTETKTPLGTALEFIKNKHEPAFINLEGVAAQ